MGEGDDCIGAATNLFAVIILSFESRVIFGLSLELATSVTFGYL